MYTNKKFLNILTNQSIVILVFCIHTFYFVYKFFHVLQYYVDRHSFFVDQHSFFRFLVALPKRVK